MRHLLPPHPCCFSGLTSFSPPGSFHSSHCFHCCSLHVPGKPSTTGPFPCYSQGRLLHFLQVFSSRHFTGAFPWLPYLKTASLCPPPNTPFYSSSWFYNLNLHIKYFTHVIYLTVCFPHKNPLQESRDFCLVHHHILGILNNAWHMEGNQIFV